MITRFFFDTEFIDDGKTVELISIAVVSHYGEFYAVNQDCDMTRADEWVQKNVVAKLPVQGSPSWMTKTEIRDRLKRFIQRRQPPYEFWAYFADYDWVVFCQLFGKMLDLPHGFPHYCCDLKQEMRRQNIPREHLPPIADEHNALSDARWVKRVFDGGVGKEWVERVGG